MNAITIDFTNSVATYTSPTKTVTVKVNNSDHKSKLIERAMQNAKVAGLVFKITGQLPNHYTLYNSEMDTGIKFNDACPVHQTPVRRTYTFGRYQDAEVVTYSGCACAVSVKMCDMFSNAVYHTSYGSAESRASYLKQSASAYYRM